MSALARLWLSARLAHHSKATSRPAFRLNRTRKSSKTSPLIYAAPAALVAIGLGVALATAPHKDASASDIKVATAEKTVAAPAAKPVETEVATTETSKTTVAEVKPATAPTAASAPAPFKVASNGRTAPRATARPDLGKTTPPADEIAGQPSGPTALAPPPVAPASAPDAAARPELGATTPPADEIAGQPSARSPSPCRRPPRAPPADQAQAPATAPSDGPVATNLPPAAPLRAVL